MTTDVRRKLIVFACFLVTALTLIPVVMMVLVAFQSDVESMAAKPSCPRRMSTGSTAK